MSLDRYRTKREGSDQVRHPAENCASNAGSSFAPFAREHRGLLRARGGALTRREGIATGESHVASTFARTRASNPRFFSPAPRRRVARPGGNQGSRPHFPSVRARADVRCPQSSPQISADPRRCMIAARAEDTTDIENSDSDDDANEKTPTPPSSTNPSSERGSSPDKQLPGPGGENTAVHPDDGEKHAPDPSNLRCVPRGTRSTRSSPSSTRTRRSSNPTSRTP